MTIRIKKREYQLDELIWKYIPAIISSYLTYLLYKFHPVKKKENSIVFFGHRFNGNLSAFANWLIKNKKGYEIMYLADDPKYYSEIKKKESKYTVLSCQKVTHLMRVMRAKAVITSHGPWTLQVWKDIRNRPKFVDVWHGAGFKDRTRESTKPLHFYEAHFIPSETYKEFFKRWGLGDEQLKVTGYARNDQLVAYDSKNSQRRRILKELDIESYIGKKIILYAPTWKKTSEVDIFPFKLTPEEFFGKSEEFAVENDVLMIFSTHLNTRFKDQGKSWENIKLISAAEFSNAEDLLKITDILITDWSSIYTDFMALARPTIFIKNKPTFKGFTLLPKDRVGDMVGSMSELLESLKIYIDKPGLYLQKYGELFKKARRKVWEGNLDGKSSERYFNYLRKVIK